MRDWITDFRNTIETSSRRLHAINEGEAARQAGTAWSAKQTLGHLIDSAANSDFAVQAVNWLLDRSELMAGIGPRPIAEYKLTITASELSKVLWLLLAGMPGLVLLLGLVVWARRRK